MTYCILGPQVPSHRSYIYDTTTALSGLFLQLEWHNLRPWEAVHLIKLWSNLAWTTLFWIINLSWFKQQMLSASFLALRLKLSMLDKSHWLGPNMALLMPPSRKFKQSKRRHITWCYPTRRIATPLHLIPSSVVANRAIEVTQSAWIIYKCQLTFKKQCLFVLISDESSSLLFR